jgi:hypothetical protein
MQVKDLQLQNVWQRKTLRLQEKDIGVPMARDYRQSKLYNYEDIM